MHRITAASLALIAGLIALAPAEPPARERAPAPVVVGTFDSRGLLIAWVRSAEFRTYMKELKPQVAQAAQRARAAGDETTARALDAIGPAMQQRIHEQGFGTAPVDEILARLKPRLPAIAKQAGVDVIVSKWQLTYRGPKVKFVDVTEQLAAGFKPDADTLKTIREIAGKDPVPLDRLQRHKDG